MSPSVISIRESNDIFAKLFRNQGSPLISAVNKIDYYLPLTKSKASRKDTDQLMLALAHEVRNPLTNINLAVKLLESALKDDELKSYLDIITRSSVRINNLVKEFLNQQLPDKILVEKESIQQLLEEVLEMTRDRIKLKNIIIKKDYAVKEFKMLLDKQKIKIALTNIIINAIDSMDSKNGELKITTSFFEGKYVVEIEDNGCGISKKNLEKIFDPYFTNKKGGLGLGLGTVSDILRSNHVELDVESKEDNGTRFILSFNTDPWHERRTLRSENAGIAQEL